MGIKAYLIAAVVLIALIASCSIVRNCRKFWNPRPPSPPHSDRLAVIRATTGASLECLDGRRKRLVNLADIAAPAAGEPFAEESRANLERIAGKTIRVESARRGLFRSEAVVLLQQVDDQGKVIKEEYVKLGDGEPRITDEQYEKLEDAVAGAQLALQRIYESPEWREWLLQHLSTCDQCRRWQEHSGVMCKQTLAKLTALDSQRRLEEEAEATAEAPEGRGPIVGVVFGESGACLNFEQVGWGMAKCLPGADKEWVKQEAIAKKKKLGVWK